MHVVIDLTGQDSHNSVSAHIHGDSSAWLEQGTINFRSAAYNESGAARCPNQNSVVSNLLMHITNLECDVFQILQLNLRSFHELLLVVLLVSETSVSFLGLS